MVDSPSMNVRFPRGSGIWGRSRCRQSSTDVARPGGGVLFPTTDMSGQECDEGGADDAHAAAVSTSPDDIAVAVDHDLAPFSRPYGLPPVMRARQARAILLQGISRTQRAHEGVCPLRRC